MLAYFIGVIILLAFLVSQQSRSLRLWIFMLISSMSALVVAGSYAWNESFRGRLDQTSILLQRFDFPGLNYALSYRLEIWSPAWELIRQHWLFGIGPGQFREEMMSLLPAASWHAQAGLNVMHAHQVLLEIALGTGIIGLTSFLFYYAYVAATLWRHRLLLLNGRGFELSGMIIFLLMWLPFGTQMDFYGSDQMFFTFYFLSLSIGSLMSRRAGCIT